MDTLQKPTDPPGLIRRLSESLAHAVPGPDAPGAADLDLSLLPLVHKLSDSLAHSVDHSGHDRDYLPIDMDPMGALDVARDMAASLSAALQHERTTPTNENGHGVTADQSQAARMDDPSLPKMRRLTERLIEALSDPESGSNGMPLDIDVHAVAKVEEALHINVHEKAKDFLEKGDDLGHEHSCERSLWVL